MTGADEPPTLAAWQRAHPAGMELAAHSHAEGQLALALTGTMAIATGQGRWLAPPGRAIWVPPGVEHSARYGEASVIVQALVPAAAAPGFPADCAVIEVSPLLRELVMEATRLADGDPAVPAMLTLIARECRRVARQPALHTPLGRDPRLRAVMQRLLDDPGCDTGLPELALAAGASPRTMARLFQAETGMRFTRWREHLRVTVAIERLLRGQSVTGVAFDLGYRSPAAFTTMFKRLTGTPPARMRRMTR